MNDVEKVVARLVVHDMCRMSNTLAAEVARWLRRTAKTIVRDRALLANEFSATYQTFTKPEDADHA